MISPQFQIVIPAEVRHALKLEGELVAARGMFAGIDTHVPNDPEDWTGAGFT